MVPTRFGLDGAISVITLGEILAGVMRMERRDPVSGLGEPHAGGRTLRLRVRLLLCDADL